MFQRLLLLAIYVFLSIQSISHSIEDLERDAKSNIYSHNSTSTQRIICTESLLLLNSLLPSDDFSLLLQYILDKR